MAKGSGASDNSGGGYGGWGGFPFRQVSQQVRVDEAKETKELLAQFRTATLIIWGVFWLYYTATNFMFGVTDWYAVVRGTQVGVCLAVLLYVRHFLWENVNTYFLAGDKDNPNSGYIGTHSIFATVFASVLFIGLATQTTNFTVSTLRYPEGTWLFFDGIPYIIRYGAITLALSVTLPAISIVLRLVWRELPDNFHGDIEIEKRRQELELEWAKFEWEKQRFSMTNAPKAIADAPITQPLLVQKNPSVRLLTSQEAYNTAFVEFLDGLEDGDFSTDEASWKNIILPQSGYKVTAIGGKVRDALIAAGWAMWNHPQAKNQGWKIRPDATISEIRAKIHDGRIDA